MKMPRIKFEWSFLTVLLFPLLLDFASGAIQLSHHKATKELGANFMVTCRDDAGRSVSWSGPKGALGTKTHPGVEVSSYGTSLVFMSITKDDSGAYTCRAGQESAQFHLTVEVPLTFMDTPPEQVGKEYTDVTLRCEVKGGDKSVLIWTSEGRELPSPKYEQMGDGLLIRNVTRADSKTYTCRAMQLSTGNIRDQKITLKVEHKPVPRHPHLWKQVDQAWGFIGGDVNLTCEVDANPTPKFEWYRKNRLLTVKDRTIYETHRSILQLHINNAMVFGDYKCKAWNKLGKLEKFITLQQGIQPEPPDLIELRKAYALSIELGIRGPDMTNKTIVHGMEPVGFRVQYKPLDENSEWDQAGVVDFSKQDADDPYTIIDLNRDTSYEVRVATRNLAGISDYTNASIFKTLKSSAEGIFLMSPYLLLVYLCCPIFGAMLL